MSIRTHNIRGLDAFKNQMTSQHTTTKYLSDQLKQMQGPPPQKKIRFYNLKLYTDGLFTSNFVITLIPEKNFNNWQQLWLAL